MVAHGWQAAHWLLDAWEEGAKFVLIGSTDGWLGELCHTHAV